MNKPRILFVLFAVITALAWVFIFRVSHDILAAPHREYSTAKPESETAFSTSFTIVNKALAIPEYKTSVYDATFEAPFKTVLQTRLQPASTSAKTPAPPVARPRLSLQGVLFKSNPLSILANESGATFILGVGDSIVGQKIVSISKTTVTLKDKYGTYELSVKE